VFISDPILMISPVSLRKWLLCIPQIAHIERDLANME
jgi:hypothetical protein